MSAPSPAQPLLARLREGEPAAARAVQSWVESATFPFRSRLGADWADVQQEVFVEVLKGTEGRAFDTEPQLRSFVARAAVHTCIDRLRSKKRWRMESIEELAPPSRGPEAAGLPAWLALRRMIARVPEECRRLWRMLVDGYSYSEMADRTGVRAGTLRVRVLRCRERIREVRAELGSGSRSESQGGVG